MLPKEWTKERVYKIVKENKTFLENDFCYERFGKSLMFIGYSNSTKSSLAVKIRKKMFLNTGFIDSRLLGTMVYVQGIQLIDDFVEEYKENK